MAVICDDHPHDDPNAAVIHGRPDFARKGFGVTFAKTFPPYVFSTRGVSCLVHKIARVELHWWRVGGSGGKLIKMLRPVMIAHTTCSTFFRLQGKSSRTCQLPNPDAFLCGRCHGQVATFGKHGPATEAGVTRQYAHVKLGCVVKGY